MKRIRLISFIFVLTVGCGSNDLSKENLNLTFGSEREKNALAEVKRLAVQHGYHHEKMELEIKLNPETGDFSIFMFPKPLDAHHLRRELGLFALVNAKSGQVIRFSDSALESRKCELSKRVGVSGIEHKSYSESAVKNLC